MNKTELIDVMASKTGMTKKNAEAALNAFVETVSEQLAKGDKISLVGFGTFEVAERAEITVEGTDGAKARKVKGFRKIG